MLIYVSCSIVVDLSISVGDLKLQLSEVNVLVCVVYHVNCGFTKPFARFAFSLWKPSVSRWTWLDERVWFRYADVACHFLPLFVNTVCHTGEYNWAAAAAAAAKATAQEDEALAVQLLQANRVSFILLYGENILQLQLCLMIVTIQALSISRFMHLCVCSLCI